MGCCVTTTGVEEPLKASGPTVLTQNMLGPVPRLPLENLDNETVKGDFLSPIVKLPQRCISQLTVNHEAEGIIKSLENDEPDVDFEHRAWTPNNIKSKEYIL